MKSFRAQVLLCAGGACISSGAESVRDAFIRELGAHGLDGEIGVVTTGCMGMCEIGPIVVIYPEGVFYQKVKPADVAEIVGEHLLKGRVVRRLFYKKPSTQELVQAMNEIDFFRLQEKIALRNCGNINPEDIREYIAADGYAALGKALTQMAPPQVIEQIAVSRLTQRSGVSPRPSSGAPRQQPTRASSSSATPMKAIRRIQPDRNDLEGDPHAHQGRCNHLRLRREGGPGLHLCRAEYPWPSSA